MALTLEGYREALEADRNAGNVGHQRFTFTQYLFIALGDIAFVMIRHQWAMSRLCGATLYHEAWYGLGTQLRGSGDRFKNSMNDAFELFVGGILHWTAKKGKGMQKLVDESDIQVRMEGAEEHDAFRTRLDAAGRRSLRRDRRLKSRSES